MDESTRKQLQRGQRVTELMKQPQYSPMSTAEIGFALFAANNGFLDDVEVTKVVDFQAALLSYLRSEQSELLAKINNGGKYDDDIAAAMTQALKTFKSKNTW